MRTCKRCHESKPLDRFPLQYGRTAKAGSREYTCHSCRNLIDNLRQYGLTIEQYFAMLTQQNDVCAVCGRPQRILRPNGNGEVKRLGVDHCHNTGVVRGLLCDTCNRAIGLIGNDPSIATAMARYLKGGQ